MSNGDLSNYSMRELFGLEVESQSEILTAGLLVLERDPVQGSQLEACMRAAHSLKGAARILELDAGVRIAHLMEDCFVSAQTGRIRLGPRHIDALLQGVDLLGRIGKIPEDAYAQWFAGAGETEVDACCARISAAIADDSSDLSSDAVSDVKEAEQLELVAPSAASEPEPPVSVAAANRVLRVSADKLDRLLAQAGEVKVETRWLVEFNSQLLRLRRMQHEMIRSLGTLNQQLSEQNLGEAAALMMLEVHKRATACRSFLGDRLEEFERYEGRTSDLSHRLYDEALGCRMRPFADGTGRFARMVRDLAASLGKSARLEIIGADTQVDRDILQKLEAPLGHLLRNAVDHGVEPAHKRRSAGKPEAGLITLEARHNAGLLEVRVSDDGAGIDIDRVRDVLLTKGLISEDMASNLSEAELLDFLFLPGFTLKSSVTEISGRGVGLDVVHDMIRQVRGVVRVQTTAGEGTSFRLQLPLTLSVARSLLMEIAGEVYALPLSYIGRTLKVPATEVLMLEGRPHIALENRSVSLLSLAQVLELDAPVRDTEALSVLLIGPATQAFGLVVDRFLGERELVVRPLHAGFGKLKNISAGSVLEDGSPILMLDHDDLLRSVEKLAGGDTALNKLYGGGNAPSETSRKRVLVVDDSLTVRELERKLLASRGFEVEIAVDGMDGWNAVRTGKFDLVVTDVDMPRMDGIELVTLIRSDPRLSDLLVMIVSYKDREEDRKRGLQAGADYYLTKSSFHEDALLQAVEDLIGDATS
ncbi:hybrid sensor histidine kinase/response regulator [Allohahella sp. A8]|uniref:hybrid sensor histidine kinase/response regulator n=1 Tax=Allohahella sp. A8 TaxID=3141461 RepID=UPI003A80109D